MGGGQNSGYARLPDEILEEVMGEAERTIEGAHNIIDIDRDILDRARLIMAITSSIVLSQIKYIS